MIYQITRRFSVDVSVYGNTPGCRRRRYGIELHTYKPRHWQLVLSFHYLNVWLNYRPSAEHSV